MKIIGVHGFAGHGKDTLVSMLQDIITWGPTVHEKFARPLKEFCFIAFGSNEQNKNEVIPELGKTHRMLMQLVGTEVCRSIDPDFWTNSMSYRISKEYDDTVILISDIRFNNEAQWVRDHGGINIFLFRPNQGERMVHSSEKGIDTGLIDHILVNDGTLADLEKKAVKLVQDLGLRASAVKA